MSTILPRVRPSSLVRWAAAASASGNVSAIGTRRSPLSALAASAARWTVSGRTEDRVRSDGRIGEAAAQRQGLRAAEAVDRDAAHDPTLVPPGGPGNRAGPVVAAGTLGGVSRVFFTPKWLLRHVLALVLIAACLRLGWWQLDEARRTGDAQNIGYTLEWPVFALAVVFVWVRLMQWEINPPAKGSRLSRPLHPAPPAPAAPAAQVTVPRDETDERLDRYNAYLARLAAEEERR
jgi:hypothetical protein